MSGMSVSLSLEDALRQNDPLPALRMAAEQFMGGQLWSLVRALCKVYILWVHRGDIDWMTSCVRWVKHVQELKACYEHDHGKWQHDRFARTELCSLVTRLVTAPKQFYTEVLDEWGIPWTGRPTGVSTAAKATTVDPNIEYLMSRVRGDKNERERMEHLMKLNNENTDDAMSVWRRLQATLRELLSERWTLPDVSLYGAAIAAASISATSVSNTASALRYAEERQLATFESVAQSFFYLLHSMLFDTTRQFGRRTVKLSQYHLWGLMDDLQSSEHVLDEAALDTGGVAPPVDLQSFRELAMWCSTTDPSLNTSAFLVACILLVQRIKTIRFLNEQKRLRDRNSSAQSQAMETKRQLLTPLESAERGTEQARLTVLGSPYDFLFEKRPKKVTSRSASTASARQDPALEHQYEQYLTTSFGLSSTYGGVNGDTGKTEKKAIEFKF